MEDNDDKLRNYEKKELNNENCNKILFEQYKIYVDSANKVSEWRNKANSFFITINIFLFSTGSVFTLEPNGSALLSFIGIVISVAWFFIIRSHRILNTAKYIIIQKIEEELAVNMYAYEWRLLEQEKYVKLSILEQIVPIILILLHCVNIINILLPV